MRKLYSKRIICHVFSRAFFKMRKRIEARKFGKKIKLTSTELDFPRSPNRRRNQCRTKSISGYEPRASLSSIRTLVKIAKVLKKPVSYILDDSRGCLSNFLEDDNKKSHFEVSLRGTHKQSTSQNIPIREHKRSSSVILG